jgi:purine-nucleoside phosphorylase
MSPQTMLILGSGLGALAERIDADFAISYADIPWCAPAGMPDHAGRLIFGKLAGVPLVVAQGRLHGYEGHSAPECVFPLLIGHALGARRLIVTNAAGAINTGYQTGELMLIADHINFTGTSPLTLNEDGKGLVRNFDMSYAYTPALRAAAHAAAGKCGILLREGVYLGLRGPSFETPAEIRAFRTWGADAVGMSTVHEVIMASALQMEVCGISMITNMAAGILDARLTTGDVTQAAIRHADAMGILIEELLRTAPGSQ